jgi:hypothetical protein
MNLDRRDIAPLLRSAFPTLARASSEEWHCFLDKVTGLETPFDMPNSVAFDRWREALAKEGYPVFRYTDADIAAKKAKAADMLRAEEARAAFQGKTLADLAREAPNWTVAEMLSSKRG